MTVFISYSLAEHEQYIVTLLSYRLREQGFSLILSNYNDKVDVTTKYQIFMSDLFVGLVTVNSLQQSRVLEEYDLALHNKTQSILLIEQGVYVDPYFHGEYIVFNRQNLQDAIGEVEKRFNSKREIKQRATAWMLGGAAIVAFLSLLSNNSKR